jgi:hypothetical protein
MPALHPYCTLKRRAVVDARLCASTKRNVALRTIVLCQDGGLLPLSANKLTEAFMDSTMDCSHISSRLFNQREEFNPQGLCVVRHRARSLAGTYRHLQRVTLGTVMSHVVPDRQP